MLLFASVTSACSEAAIMVRRSRSLPAYFEPQLSDVNDVQLNRRDRSDPITERIAHFPRGQLWFPPGQPAPPTHPPPGWREETNQRLIQYLFEIGHPSQRLRLHQARERQRRDEGLYGQHFPCGWTLYPTSCARCGGEDFRV